MRISTIALVLFHIALPVILSGCAMYEFKNENCGLRIWSMREVNVANIRISKNCALTGGAEGMTYNEQQMAIFQKLVEKIP